LGSPILYVLAEATSSDKLGRIVAARLGVNKLPSYLTQKMKLTLASTLAVFVTSVAAHGYVEQVTIGSTTYTGYLPYRYG